MDRPRFHLAFPIDDLAAAERFYAGLLGCPIGRRAERWIDFSFFGHQISAHLVDRAGVPTNEVPTNEVDGDGVPVRHFGAILERGAWEALARKLRDAGVPFLIEPRVRFAGLPGEQGTFFVRDPAGNAIELKTFADDASVFRTE